MNVYQVTIGQKGRPRLSFEAMSSDSCSCVMQHLDLAEMGERVSVKAVQSSKVQQDKRNHLSDVGAMAHG